MGRRDIAKILIVSLLATSISWSSIPAFAETSSSVHTPSNYYESVASESDVEEPPYEEDLQNDLVEEITTFDLRASRQKILEVSVNVNIVDGVAYVETDTDNVSSGNIESDVDGTITIYLNAAEGYFFGLVKANQVSVFGATYKRASKKNLMETLVLDVTTDEPLKASSSNASAYYPRLSEKIVSEYINCIKAHNRVSMRVANTPEEIEQYIAPHLPINDDERVEITVTAGRSLIDGTHVGDFYPASAGTRENRNGRLGSSCITVSCKNLLRDDDDYKATTWIYINPVPYSSGGSGGSGGGGGGGSSSRSVGYAGNAVVIPDTYRNTTWQQNADGSWQLKKPDGTDVTGWVAKGGKWYYLSPETKKMQTEWFADTDGKKYYLDSTGAMSTKWILVDNFWYYMDASGAMQTGWQLIDGKWYFLQADGKMLANTTTPDGYNVDATGAWIEK